MSIQIPRGTQDILPGTVELWQYIEGASAKFAVVTIIKKFVHQFLNTLSYFYAVLVIRQISYKKKCTHSRSWRA